MIQLQRLHGGSAYWRSTDQTPSLPTEMLIPGIPTRVEEWNDRAGFGIDRLNTIRLVEIARGTTPGQVVRV